MTAPSPPVATPVAPERPRRDVAEAPFRMASVGKHTLVYGGGVLLSKALAFVMLPVYTRFLTPADYGVIGLIDMTLDVIAIVAGPQIAQGIFRFYHKVGTDQGRREVVSTALLALGTSYLLVAAVAFAASPLLSTAVFGTGQHAGLIRLAAAATACQAGLLVPLAYARVRDRSTLFVAANAAKLVLGATLNMLFIVVMRMGPEGVFTSTLICNATVGGALTAWLLRHVGVHPSAATLRLLLRFGLPLVGTQFATFLLTFGDRYFLQRSAGVSEVGVYNLAYQFGFLLAVVGFVPFDQVWGPKRFEIAERGDRDELLARGFTYASVLLLTTAVGIVLFVEPVLTVMSDESFHGAADLVPLILVAYVLQSWGKTQDIGILVRERTELITLADWTAAAVALGGYAVLVPRFHGWGAAVATVVAFGVRYGLTYFLSQRMWPVRYHWEPVLRLVALAVVVSVAALALPEGRLGFVANLAARLALLGVYVVMALKLGVLSPAERAWIARSAWRTYRAALAGARARVSAAGDGSSPSR